MAFILHQDITYTSNDHENTMEPLNSHEKEQWIPVHICSILYGGRFQSLNDFTHICFITPTGTFNNCGV